MQFLKNYPKLKKNTKRAMPSETKYEVQARDGCCIICRAGIDEYHHAYYGRESVYTPNRNSPDQIVGLCNSCHHKLHNEG
jgi:cytochrome c553